MQTITNAYLKDDGSHRYYMSGSPIPYDLADNVCRNVRFVECGFHPECAGMKFEDCIFDMCQIDDYSKYNMVGCQIIYPCTWCTNPAVTGINCYSKSDIDPTKTYHFVFHACRAHIGKNEPENLFSLQ